MSEVSLPVAPVLNGEILLDVYTHPSLRTEGGGDNERYALLGEQVFQAAITHAIMLRFPKFRGKEIVEEREKLLSEDSYNTWTAYYHFNSRLRFHPTAQDEVSSARGARELFHAYVGGVYMQANGPAIVNSWVFNLISPAECRIKEEQAIYRSPPPPNVPYPMPPPPPPGIPSYPRSRTSSFSSGRHAPMNADVDPAYATTTTGKIVYLPRFNEICTQRRLNVQYSAEQGGLQHAPRWVVNCIVDGMTRGQGTATTKQLAKEEAAKQAWLSFGWSMP